MFMDDSLKTIRQEFHSKALQMLADPNPDLASAAGQIVSAMAKIELPKLSWSSLFTDILTGMAKMQGISKVAPLKCLQYICQDCKLETIEPFSNALASGLSSCLTIGENPPEVLVQALKSLEEAAPCLRIQMGNRQLMEALFIPVVDLCGSVIGLALKSNSFTPSAAHLAAKGQPIPLMLRKAALQCVQELVDVHYTSVYSVMDSVYAVTSDGMNQWIARAEVRKKRELAKRMVKVGMQVPPDQMQLLNAEAEERELALDEEYDEIAKLSIAVWDKLCTQELEAEKVMDEEALEVIDTPAEGSQGGLKPLKVTDDVAVVLVPLLFRMMSMKEFGEKELNWNAGIDAGTVDEDDGDEEGFDYVDTATTLNDAMKLCTSIAKKMGREILPIAGPLISSGFESTDPGTATAALDLFSCVLEGCIEDDVGEMTISLLPTLQKFFLPIAKEPQTIRNPYAVLSHLTPPPSSMAIPSSLPYPTPSFPHAPLSKRKTASHTLAILCEQSFIRVYHPDNLAIVLYCIIACLQDKATIALQGTLAAYNLAHCTLEDDDDDEEEESNEGSANSSQAGVQGSSASPFSSSSMPTKVTKEMIQDILPVLFRHLLSSSLRTDSKSTNLSSECINAATEVCSAATNRSKAFLFDQMQVLIEVINRKKAGNVLMSLPVQIPSAALSAPAELESTAQLLLVLMGGDVAPTNDKQICQSFLISDAMKKSLLYKDRLLVLMNMIISILEEGCKAHIVRYMESIDTLTRGIQYIENKAKESASSSSASSSQNIEVNESQLEGVSIVPIQPAAARQIVSFGELMDLKKSLIDGVKHCLFLEPENGLMFLTHFIDTLLLPALCDPDDEDLFIEASTAVGFASKVMKGVDLGSEVGQKLYVQLVGAWYPVLANSFYREGVRKKKGVWKALMHVADWGGLLGYGIAIQMLPLMIKSATPKLSAEGLQDDPSEELQYDDKLYSLRCRVLIFISHFAPYFVQMTQNVPAPPSCVKPPPLPSALAQALGSSSTTISQLFLLSSFLFIKAIHDDVDNSATVLIEMVDALLVLLRISPTIGSSQQSVFFTFFSRENLATIWSICNVNSKSAKKKGLQLKRAIKDVLGED
ncbi:uncharacterized protein MONOS_2114 [Monocercomonoides exilis]|uniref:uncharacterized protein n=1 Tax=Monocercomonoides exilis TaxID=2049356 RepID=UPI00355ACB76|nr:hypothetical protein MONOS_2114 [Monocercomonoides exilis]|eukprot:MONOS_2114.1-p1 / transcript=MONOS_2114.1 / gene=MONOS_2114 / organism=Monocercomonoides_exilis_PA203 / gene_product=unspecified product / transcript_product=unspecified product / location=Mono_scaffold00041:133811-137354(-) / protein_length=1101 / sequence_SO=supercontig / SO=protein_coding / is_pseudo=false